MPDIDEIPDFTVRLQKDCDGSDRWFVMVTDENTGARIGEVDLEKPFDVILALSAIGRKIVEDKAGEIAAILNDLPEPTSVGYKPTRIDGGGQ